MNTAIKTLTLIFTFGTALGCNTSFPNSSKLLSHHRTAPLENVGQIRTGGEFVIPKTISLEKSQVLTLRNAVLQSGGLRRQDTILATASAPLEMAPSVSATVTVEAPADPVAIQSIAKVLEDESAVRQLLAVRRNDVFGATAQYEKPSGVSLLTYLQSAVSNIETSTAFDPTNTLDVTRLNANSLDPIDLLNSLKYVFNATRDNSPEFAALGINTFDDLEKRLAPPISSPPLMSTMTFVPAAPSPLVSISPLEPMLIGIENTCDPDMNQNKTYLHPDLVMKTAVGDTPLRDGDFVFAIRAKDTLLPRRIPVEHDWSVPVLGVSQEFTAIDPNQFKTIGEVLTLKLTALKESEQFATTEDVCVLSRKFSGMLGTQTFYLPVGDSKDSAVDIPLGSVLPGDSFQFTDASRSPFVLERLLRPIKERVQAQQIESQKQKDCRKLLPVDGRYLSKANANWKYYTRPVVESARNLVK